MPLPYPQSGPVKPLHAPSLSPQNKPVAFKNALGELSSAFKVDSAFVRGRKITLSGWATPNCEMQIWHGGERLPSVMHHTMRPDISKRLNIDEPALGFGFTITARNLPGFSGGIDLHIRITRGGRGVAQEHAYPITLVDDHALPARGGKAALAAAAGCLQEAKLSSVTGDLLVVGWLLATDQLDVWIENQDGDEFSLDDAYRYFLPEVAGDHAAQFGHSCTNAGFMLRQPEASSSQTLRLMMSDGDTIRVLSQCTVSRMAVDPLEAARWLFGFPISNRTLHKRISQIDQPLLNPLIDHDRRGWHKLPVEHRVLGVQPVAPKVSLVIPLYGRSDFVEHHLIEFLRDTWLQKHVEVIYVVDDRLLLEEFATQASQLHRLYQHPFQWVWGSANRGYSGANNLGATFATADVLLFMNSDVLPIQPGWIRAMFEALEQNPAMGAVTPRLLFADGALQHAGMQFVRKEDLGIWVNHHPFFGCPPEADPCVVLTAVAAVTGACMAIPRRHFDQMGRWDTGYLTGDFEDSDMCHKLRAAGLDIGYLPTVSLIHLERQSFPFVGLGEFRQRVTIFNAVRHQQRWALALKPCPSVEQTTSGAQG